MQSSISTYALYGIYAYPANVLVSDDRVRVVKRDGNMDEGQSQGD
jgi:hypothetical protein